MSDGYIELNAKEMIRNIPKSLLLDGNGESICHVWGKIVYDNAHQTKKNNRVLFRQDQVTPVPLYRTGDKRYFYSSALKNTSDDIIPGLPIRIDDPAVTDVFVVRAWIVYNATHKRHRRLHLYAGYNNTRQEREDGEFEEENEDIENGQIMAWKAKLLSMTSYNCHDIADRNHFILNDKAAFLRVRDVADVVRESSHHWYNSRKKVLRRFVRNKPGIVLDRTICPVNTRAYWPSHS
jgi:hypothetical protein